jgi:hypothetical protein
MVNIEMTSPPQTALSQSYFKLECSTAKASAASRSSPSFFANAIIAAGITYCLTDIFQLLSDYLPHSQICLAACRDVLYQIRRMEEHT